MEPFLIHTFFTEYHDSLVQNGVTDYDWSQFSLDMNTAMVDGLLNMFDLCGMMKPKVDSL